jgi:hypothetical protein
VGIFFHEGKLPCYPCHMEALTSAEGSQMWEVHKFSFPVFLWEAAAPAWVRQRVVCGPALSPGSEDRLFILYGKVGETSEKPHCTNIPSQSRGQATTLSNSLSWAAVSSWWRCIGALGVAGASYQTRWHWWLLLPSRRPACWCCSFWGHKNAPWLREQAAGLTG